ncbi:MAG: BON domain-containing protein, partial [Methylicorpusculum sp.]
MPTRLPLVLFTLTGSLLLMSGSVQAEQGAVLYLANGSSSELENTERNVRDRDDATLTPVDQKETEGDITITAAIRQAVVRNESLSVNAQNTKI